MGKVQANHFDPLNLIKGKLVDNVYKKNPFINAVEAQNHHFSDSGFFSLRSTISGNKVNETIDLLAD